MTTTSSYKVQVVGINKAFHDTVDIYRSALSYIINVVEAEWSSLEPVFHNTKTKKQAMGMVENLVISKKSNNYVTKYDFENHYYKIPSYMRRAIINKALGAVSSYHSNLDLYIQNGSKGKPPRLQPDTLEMPTFYRGNCFLDDDDIFNTKNNKVFLKFFYNNDWVWVPVQLREQDVKYIRKYWAHKEMSAPTLEKHYNKYYLRFAFKEKQTLTQTPEAKRTILAVDLGINTDAACSVMQPDGTVVARKFINFPAEKDHLEHTLNKIKQASRDYGPSGTSALWREAANSNIDLANKVSTAITDFAVLWSCETIVFEHLDMKGKISGSKKQKLHMWRKQDIQHKVEHKAHRCGIRISRICAWNTSRLAYDGSGRVERNAKNHALCVFPTGKQYNCDLSASYNIGARYYIRAIFKALPVKAESCILAKVPECKSRTCCTWSTLISLNAAIDSLATV